MIFVQDNMARIYLKPFKYAILCALGLICFACQSKHEKSPAQGDTNQFDIQVAGDTTTITIYSPWKKGEVMQQLVFQNSYERVVCTSATHMGFISELGQTDKVLGVCRPNRIYNLGEEHRARIVDIGDDMHPNIETILSLKPDIVILYTYAQGDPLPTQFTNLGIPILYCNEWTATTPLERAEWIRLFGAILGCQEQADSIYCAVCNTYNAIRLSPNHSSSSLNTIMSGMSWRGTWYVPAGGTFMGNLFRDAGASYKYEDNPSNSSIPLTLEQAIQDFSQADIWVGCEANSLKELASIDSKHTWFSAYQNRQVYNFRRRALPSGANDFWESATVHPERILLDLKKILAGDTLGLYYAMPLK